MYWYNNKKNELKTATTKRSYSGGHRFATAVHKSFQLYPVMVSTIAAGKAVTTRYNCCRNGRSSSPLYRDKHYRHYLQFIKNKKKRSRVAVRRPPLSCGSSKTAAGMSQSKDRHCIVQVNNHHLFCAVALSLLFSGGTRPPLWRARNWPPIMAVYARQ